ncbi:unnamed protein product [Macrosiphum euphorbiae]|uniref:Uncharacterized protein n=1 Tax=Macrosiphum euphorbiae TaxID=13131 RepID=A0AAV0VXN9_9HEMI|nr:unnamed protein product [Macrosiphum euphorbiae]
MDDREQRAIKATLILCRNRRTKDLARRRTRHTRGTSAADGEPVERRRETEEALVRGACKRTACDGDGSSAVQKPPPRAQRRTSVGGSIPAGNSHGTG